MDRIKWKVEVEGVSNGGWGPKNIGTKDTSSSAILEEDGVRTRSRQGPSYHQWHCLAEPKTNGKRKRTGPGRCKRRCLDISKRDSRDRATTPAPGPTTPSSPGRRSQRIVQNTTVNSPPAPREPSPVKLKKNGRPTLHTHDEWRAFDYQKLLAQGSTF